ncbi:MAG: hypothetical protein ACPG4Z_04310, partial [Chitinophagales bacterium]
MRKGIIHCSIYLLFIIILSVISKVIDFDIEEIYLSIFLVSIVFSAIHLLMTLYYLIKKSFVCAIKSSLITILFTFIALKI